jgi:hypothetical protein
LLDPTFVSGDFRPPPSLVACPQAPDLSYFRRSAFFPEGKMNDRAAIKQNSQKIAKKDRLSPVFP